MPGMMEQDSGTDDDLPPPSLQHTHQQAHTGRVTRGGRIGTNGRAAQSSQAAYHHARPSNHAASAEQQIRRLEQEAYTSVLRAFHAQSEAITWSKEEFISELRVELRVSEEVHRETLSRIRSDETIRQIRERRQTSEIPLSTSFVPHLDPSPPLSRKKQKTGHGPQASGAMAPTVSLQLPKSLPGSHSSLPSPAPGKRVPVGPRGKKSKGGRHTASVPSKASPGLSPSMASVPGSARGPGVPPDLHNADPYIGRRVKTLWPDDNKFYEGVITSFDPEEGKHALTYDADETVEWINLQEVISLLGPTNFKWVDAPVVPIVSKGGLVGGPSSSGRGVGGRGLKRSGSVHARDVPALGLGRGRGGRGPTSSNEKLPTPEVPGRLWRGAPVAAENGLERKGSRPLESAPLEALMKEVDRLEEEVDLGKLESTKRAVKEYEDQVRRALEEVGESSDEAESDDGGHPPSHSLGQEREERPKEDGQNHHGESDDEEDTAGDGRAESDGEPVVGDGGGPSSDADEDHHVEEADEADEG